MSNILSQIAGTSDSIAMYQLAAEARYAEGKILQRQRAHQAALYLYGYSVEMRLKAAFFYNEGILRLNDPIDRRDLNRAWSYRAAAGLGGNANFHDPGIWARLLVHIRRVSTILPPYVPTMELAIVYVGDLVRSQWDPTMRYRCLTITPVQMRDVFRAAAWLRSRYNAL